MANQNDGGNNAAARLALFRKEEADRAAAQLALASKQVADREAAKLDLAKRRASPDYYDQFETLSGQHGLYRTLKGSQLNWGSISGRGLVNALSPQQAFLLKRDAQQQQYTQQNMTQQETADVRAKHQEQVSLARNNGYAYSAKKQEEMRLKEELFRKNVSNNPRLSEDLKQGAMLRYQTEMSAFIPDERVVDPQVGAEQSMMQHSNGTWLNVGQDARGFPTYTPSYSGSGSNSDPAQKLRELEHKRNQALQKLRDKLSEQEDKSNDEGNLLYPDEESLQAAMRKEFAVSGDEAYYTGSGLESHDIYKAQAQRVEQMRREPPQRDNQGGMSNSMSLRSGDPLRGSPEQLEFLRQQVELERQQQNQPPMTPQERYESDTQPQRLTPGQRFQQQLQQQLQQQAQPQAQPQLMQQAPPVKQKPVKVSSANIGDVMKNADTDPRVAAALQAIQQITTKYGNTGPPDGTQEEEVLLKAMMFLHKNGISIDTKPKSKPSPKEDFRRFGGPR